MLPLLKEVFTWSCFANFMTLIFERRISSLRGGALYTLMFAVCKYFTVGSTFAAVLTDNILSPDYSNCTARSPA